MDTGNRNKPSREELLDRVRAMAPRLRERAEKAERDRRVPAETIEEMRAAELYRIMQPTRFGGFEYDFGTVARIAIEIGRSCASTAWVAGLAINHHWLIANFPLRAQEDFWGDDPETIAFGSYAAGNRAEAVDGGYLATGSWAFASGCDHGRWALLGITFPPDDEHENPHPGMVLVPVSDYTIDDDWHTIGLAGTGSKSIVCDKAFIPSHRRIVYADFVSGGSPGSKIHDNPLYRLPMLALLPFTLTAPIIGALQGAIEDFVADHGGRITRGAVVSGGKKVADFAGVQSRLAEASGALDAATLMTFRDLDETHALARAGREITVDIRIRNRLTHTYSTKLALDGINALYAATGGAGLYTNGRIQRAWRDITAASHHVSLNWDAVSTMYGQNTLGLEPQGQY